MEIDILKNWGIIIQARTGSTRLPNKMLLPFSENKSLMEVVFDNLTSYFDPSRILLATTLNKNDSILCNYAKQKNIKVYQGSESNVLKRFIEGAVQQEWKYIVRICADNPFIINDKIERMVKIGLKKSSDYTAYFFEDGLPSIKSHSGFFAEFVTLDALLKIEKYTTNEFYYEHVTNYIYSNPNLFKINKLKIEDENLIRKIRLTIDTLDDFNLAKSFYKKFENRNPLNWKEIKKTISDNPDILNTMASSIQLNQK